jgi:hypothetical protein
MNQEQLNALFGPSAPFSEHKVNSKIQFRCYGNEIKSGTILHVRAPGPTHAGGKEHSLLYMVDTGEGFPVPVKPSQIIQGTFTASLASYGYPDSALKSREQAENMVWYFDSRGSCCIETEQGRLRVITARVEGTEEQGRVIGECEAVNE